MTPSARAGAALDLLERLETSRIPMDLTIGDYMRGRRYIGSKDRADIVERVYRVVRHRARLSWVLGQENLPVSPRWMLIACFALVEKTEDISRLFDGSKYGPAVLDDAELAALEKLKARSLTAPDMPDAVRAECPPQYEDSLRGYFGKDFEEELAALTSGAPLDLRVNLLKADRDQVKESLEKDGIKTDLLRWSPWGLRVQGKAYLSETKAFRAGLVDIQDEGSQLIALACNAQPGMQVLDYCAGAGGKTLALAGAMRKKGRIVAMDLEESRLAKARDRFRRAQVSDIIEPRPLSDERHRKWLRRQKQTFDVVLADVPCSGTGTWRRNPDTRWRAYGPSLEELVKTQSEILDRVAPAVKPGGRLVYATCSLLPEENERQVEAFLARNTDFRLLPLAQGWGEGLEVPCAGDVMRLTPHRHNTDGFFAAVLQRV
jgi:16S rRNA (cytosine967-C5)-methyltransferase